MRYWLSAIISLFFTTSFTMAQEQHERRSIITAAVLRDFPPLYQLDKSNRPTGFAIDILKAVCDSAGISIHFKPVSDWAEAMALVRKGEADLIPGIGISNTRTDEFLFTEKIESVPVSCFVRKQNTRIKGIEDLGQAEATAVIVESAAHTRLRLNTSIKLITYQTIESGLFALLAGEVDAFVCPKPVLEKKAREIGMTERIKTVGNPLMDLKRAFLVNKSDQWLVDLFNPYIRSLIVSPTYQNMYLKWYGEPESFWTRRVIVIFMSSLLGFTVLGLILWRSISLSTINSRLRENLARLEQSEKSVREQQAYLQSLKENTPDSMYLCDTKGRIVDVNAAACRTLGYSRDELLSMTVSDVDIHYPALKDVEGLWENMSDGVPRTLTGEHRKKDGSVLPVEINICSLVINGSKHIIGFARDVSERRRFEEQLRQSQKMQAIGQLAGGIAHDFNNILGGIIGYADIILDMVRSDPLLEKYVKNILKCGDRARELVCQILTFSRRSDEQKRPVKLSLILHEVAELLRVTLPSSIQFSVEVSGGNSTILADAAKIHEVIMNLAVNAVHAMNEKGRLTIHLRNVQITTPQTGILGTIAPQSYALVEVSDEGCGISEQLISRIFEPFFTTKETGHGTGLGLSVVFGIMVSHGGDIQVKSTVGKGTTFRLFFPLVDTTGSSVDQTDQQQHNPPITGTEHVLYVDDETFMKDMGNDLIKGLGYRVTSTDSSLDALELFRKAPSSFDLLVTDQTMPQMTGIELIEKVLTIRPDLPVILCTGFSSKVNEQSAKEMGVAAFIKKPIRRHELAQILREVLDSKRGVIAAGPPQAAL